MPPLVSTAIATRGTVPGCNGAMGSRPLARLAAGPAAIMPRLVRPAAPLRRRVAAAACLALACLLAPGRADAAPDPVLRSLDAVARRGGSDARDAAAWRALYRRAEAAAGRLTGAPRANLAGVLANTRSLAARNLLTARARPAFLVLRRNVEWFWDGRRAAPAYGTRTTFPGSQMIFEFYPGSGWQLQPLANFSRLGAIAPLRYVRLRQVEGYADEMLDTAVWRAGFRAYEYYFPFSGGPPGWVSGMAAGAGMSALAAVWKRDGKARYRNAARAMRRVFEVPPPAGVRVRLPQGPFFLLYSQAPRELVGNGFAEAILGLDDYARATGDATAARLVSQAVGTARRLMPLYDTGAWSLYERTPEGPGPESDLSYHQLFEELLGDMCGRWRQPFCRLAASFRRYEREPVRIGGVVLVGARPKLIRLGFDVSKRSYVSVSLNRGRRVLRAYGAWLSRGRHVFVWGAVPRGRYQAVFTATSLNDRTTTVRRDVTLR